MLLNEKVALVLGAGGRDNIGQAIARRFAADGARVMVAGRNAAALEELAREIGGAACVCDITSEADLARMVGETRARFGGLDIAVNATGFNQVVPFLDLKRDDLEHIVQIQLIGTFLFMQAVLRSISDGGSIIQISSLSATAMLPNHAAYMATKSASDLLVRSLAVEFGARGIRVNSIAPGPTSDSPMAAGIMANDAMRDRIRDGIPLKRIGTGADVAEAALWLASDRSFVTGEVLHVSGGRAINHLR